MHGLHASKTVNSDITQHYYNGDSIINETLNGTDYAICGSRRTCSRGLQRAKKQPVKREKVKDISDLAIFPAEIEGLLLDPGSIKWHSSSDHKKSYCTAHYYSLNPTYPTPRHEKKKRKKREALPKKTAPHKRE